MKCERHPETDAIGNCVHCGRGVCPECRAKHGDVILCKECLAAGRTEPVKNQMAVRPDQPAKPISRVTPAPKGRPNRGYFLAGVAGAFVGGVLMFALAVMVQAKWNVFWNMGAGSQYAVDLFSMMFLGNTMPFFLLAMGCYGMFWNYGTKTGIAGSIGILVFWPLTLLFRYIGRDFIMFAITLAFLEVPLQAAKAFLPEWHTSYRVLEVAVIANFGSIVAIAFSLVNPMIAYCIVGFGLMVIALAFWHLPLPGTMLDTGARPSRDRRTL